MLFGARLFIPPFVPPPDLARSLSCRAKRGGTKRAKTKRGVDKRRGKQSRDVKTRAE